MTSRVLTCFFCRELFPLYIEGRLDKDRDDQMAKHLSSCKTCPPLLDAIKKAQKSLLQLATASPSENVLAYVKKEHHFWEEVTTKYGWSQWSSTSQWAVELCGVAIALVITIHLFPWLNLARTLQKFQAMSTPKVIVAEPPVAVVATPSPTPAAFIGPLWPKNMKPPEEYAKEQANNERIATAAEENSAPEENVGADVAQPKAAGAVWRGSLKVESLDDDVANRVKGLIETLGGTKAGQVELGWTRDGDRYYHFILPTDNYDKLLSGLNEEGFVDIKKEKHPRVIKEGYMRIIMTVEEEK